MKLPDNLSFWHRVAYFSLGSGIACAGLLFIKIPLLVGALVLGVVVAGMGVVGFCPLCYFVKRGRS